MTTEGAKIMYVMVQDLTVAKEKLIGEIYWSKALMTYSQMLVTQTSCHCGNNVILYEEWPENFTLFDGLNCSRSTRPSCRLHIFEDIQPLVRPPLLKYCLKFSVPGSCWCVATARRVSLSSPGTSWRSTSRVTASVLSACWSAMAWISPCTRITSTAVKATARLSLQFTSHSFLKKSILAL